MTDKVYTYIFNLLNQETGLLLTAYPSDENVINNIYGDYIFTLSLEEVDEVTAFVNYLTLLISFLEKKEYYEKCNQLLKLKNQIKKYKDG